MNLAQYREQVRVWESEQPACCQLCGREQAMQCVNWVLPEGKVIRRHVCLRCPRVGAGIIKCSDGIDEMVWAMFERQQKLYQKWVVMGGSS